MLNFPNRTGWGAFTRVWPHPLDVVLQRVKAQEACDHTPTPPVLRLSCFVFRVVLLLYLVSPMAQSVARQAVNLQVAGSNPAGGELSGMPILTSVRK